MTEPCYAQARVRTLLIDSMVCVERPQLMLRRARCSPENEVRGHLESNGKSADLRRHLVHVATTHLLGYSQWHIHWMVAFGSTILGCCFIIEYLSYSRFCSMAKRLPAALD